ncbi:MAG: hypothetical protein P4L46_08615 [Fimbriimonas sp.]|nr:hypothetical protein [Fimbriimonas sp.]
MWATDLTEEETEALIQKAADEIVKRGLHTPAILFLEMHKPLANVGANAALMFAPFAVPFLGFDFVNNYSRLFTKRENVERLITRIEELSKPALKPGKDE